MSVGADRYAEGALPSGRVAPEPRDAQRPAPPDDRYPWVRTGITLFTVLPLLVLVAGLIWTILTWTDGRYLFALVLLVETLLSAVVFFILAQTLRMLLDMEGRLHRLAPDAPDAPSALAEPAWVE